MILIITGCIDVNPNTPFVSIKDRNLRIEQYIDTILWSIKETNYSKIVFCDNSNYHLDVSKYMKLAQQFDKKFEYLTFTGNQKKTTQKGKGYGEGEIVEYVIKHSELLQDEESFSKITGRLKIQNINKLLRSTKKNYFINKRTGNEVDTRFYHIQKKIFINHIEHVNEKVDDKNNYYLEHAYYDCLKSNNIKYRCFYQKPLFIGKSGSTGIDYYEKKNIKWYILNFLCFINIYNSCLFNKIRKIKGRW